MKLAELLDSNDLDVLDHLDRQLAVPVLDGPQAQGDLIVLPHAMVPMVSAHTSRWQPVPPGGIELVRGVTGNNPHTLVGDPGTCEWTLGVRDPLQLGIALFTNTAPVYLIHPEHGGSGVAPGTWLVRRQQEAGFRRERAYGQTGFRPMLVAD
jgi:hypothetical protein